MTTTQTEPEQAGPPSAPRRIVDRDWPTATIELPAAAVVGATASLLGAAVWLVVVLAAYAAGLATGVQMMMRTFGAWQHEEREWAAALVTERVADGAHRTTRGVQHAVAEAIAILDSANDEGTAMDLRQRFAVCNERARKTLDAWRSSSKPGLARAAEEGYLGGAAAAAAPRSPRAMRRFATLESTPRWLRFTLRNALVKVLRGIDIVRLLHTPEIERRALITTLWLRAAIVLCAPLAAGGSLTGAVPFADDAGAAAKAVFVVIAVFSAATAVVAPRLADYTIGQPTRIELLVVEQTLATAAVIAMPCWPVAVFAAGAVNWIERPDWTLRRLLIWMGLTYVPFAVAGAADGIGAGDLIAEATIAITVTAVMAGSYGLMLPATVTTYLAALAGAVRWRVRAYRAVHAHTTELNDIINLAQAGLRRVPAGDPAATSALKGLAAARGRLDDPRQILRRRSRVLRVLCSHAITSVVAPEDSPGETDLRAASVVAQPAAVGELLIADAAVARRIERLVKGIALEAVDNGGRGLLLTHLSLDVKADGTVLVEIANGLPDDPELRKGFGTGGEWLNRWCAGIPGADEVERRFTDGTELGVMFPVHSAVFRIGRDAFRQEDDERPRSARRPGARPHQGRDLR